MMPNHQSSSSYRDGLELLEHHLFIVSNLFCAVENCHSPGQKTMTNGRPKMYDGWLEWITLYLETAKFLECKKNYISIQISVIGFKLGID